MAFHHLRYALRSLQNAPGFTALAVFTLALGIGANTAVFSVVDAVMLRPLPYPDPDRLVALWEAHQGQNEMTIPGLGVVRPGASPANLVDYNASTDAFEALAGYNLVSRNLTGSGTPEVLTGESVTWNYLEVLGMSPAIGRSFRPEEDRAGSAHVVILTDGLWRARFGANPSVLGRSIALDGTRYDVIGVMPPAFEAISGFRFPLAIRFLVTAADQTPQPVSRRNFIAANVVGRMKAGVTLQQAQTDLDAISSRLAQEFPDTNRDLRAVIAPLGSDLVRHVRASLLILWSAAAAVLLVASVNVANLLLVRTVGRQRDVAIRLALGASRGQIAIELLTRGIILGVAGGAAGLLCGIWTRDALIALAPATIPRLQTVSLSPAVLALTAAISILSGTLAGLVPALHATSPTLNETALTTSATPAVIRWRGILMATEIAAAVVLMTAAGLLVRSLLLLNRVPLGYDTDRVLVSEIHLPAYRYPDADAQIRFFEALVTRVRALPGVQSAAFASEFPVGNFSWASDFTLETSSGPIGGAADFQIVSPDYFAALGIPVVRGRAITEEDRPGAPFVAVVSQTLASTLPGDALNLQLSWGKGRPRLTIVGVVGEIRRAGRLADPTPQVFLAALQTALPVPRVVRPSSVAVRASGNLQSIAGGLQRAVWATDPEQAVTNVQTLEERLRGRVADRQFELALLSSFGILTLILALVGCYGVVSFAAAQRMREIGIRLAFGAPRREVIRLVVGSGLRWTLVGVVLGLAGAFALGRLMSTMLFAIGPTDPLTFAATTWAIIGVSLLASYIPARRIAAIDPVRALRVE